MQRSRNPGQISCTSRLSGLRHIPTVIPRIKFASKLLYPTAWEDYVIALRKLQDK